MDRKYAWCRDKLDDVVDVCFSLTNYHLCLHPLRQEDREYYLRVLLALRVRTEEIVNAGRNCQLCHRHCQQQMDMALEEDDESEFGEGNDNDIGLDDSNGGGGDDSVVSSSGSLGNPVVSSSGGGNTSVAGDDSEGGDSDVDSMDVDSVDDDDNAGGKKNLLRLIS